MTKKIIEKEIGIPPSYQYDALNKASFLQSNWHRNKLSMLSKELGETSELEILDLGTGSGNFELGFHDKVKSIVGIDYNDEALEFLEKKLGEEDIKNIKLRMSDIRDLNKHTDLGQFDVIIMMDVIEHIKFNEAKELLKKLKNFLKPGGRIIVITPNYKSSWMFLEWLLDKLSTLPILDGEQHLAKYHKKNLRAIFTNNGFREEKIFSFNLISFIFPFKSISQKICSLESKMNPPVGNLLMGIFKNDK